MNLNEIGEGSRQLMGIPPKKVKTRKPGGTGDIAVKKHWEAEMSRLPGVFIPIRIMSEANKREHWRKVAERKSSQRQHVAIAALHYILPFADRNRHPWQVKLTRYGKGVMDDDNNTNGFKYVRDEVALMLGVDDGDKVAVKFACVQEKAKHYGIRIEIEEAVGGLQS